MGRLAKAIINSSDHKVYVHLGGQTYKFAIKEYLFLQALTNKENNFDMNMAIDQTGIDPRSLNKLMSRQDTREFIAKKINEKGARDIWTEHHWFSELNDVWEGKKKVTKNQMEAAKELGARVVPKIERVQHEIDADTEYLFALKGGGKDK